MSDRPSFPVDWSGDPVPSVLRTCAETQMQPLDRCGRLRRMRVECRVEPIRVRYRIVCHCSERRRSITAARDSLALSIEAFRGAQSAYCPLPSDAP